MLLDCGTGRPKLYLLHVERRNHNLLQPGNYQILRDDHLAIAEVDRVERTHRTGSNDPAATAVATEFEAGSERDRTKNRLLRFGSTSFGQPERGEVQRWR